MMKPNYKNNYKASIAILGIKKYGKSVLCANIDRNVIKIIVNILRAEHYALIYKMNKEFINFASKNQISVRIEICGRTASLDDQRKHRKIIQILYKESQKCGKTKFSACNIKYVKEWNIKTCDQRIENYWCWLSEKITDTCILWRVPSARYNCIFFCDGIKYDQMFIDLRV